jgi:hypothetical protein
MKAARRREIDVMLLWRLDRWGRSVTDLLATLQELEHLGVGLVSLTEALDLTTPAGGTMAVLLAIFAEFERENQSSAEKPLAGQAIAYTLKNWTAFTRYCGNGDLSIDNPALSVPCGDSRSGEIMFSSELCICTARPWRSGEPGPQVQTGNHSARDCP